MEYIHIRRGLSHLDAALKRKEVTIGFVGGSITEPCDGKRWSDKIADWFVFTYPDVKFTIENSAKGANGSLSAVFTVDREILPYKCDIVFIETAVNDKNEAFGDCREGMLRKLMASGCADMVLVYTYCQRFYDSMLDERIPDSIMDWEKMAEYYKISSVHAGQYAFDLAAKGFMRWEEWLPDGLHPDFAGSRVYAECVEQMILQAISQPAPEMVLPAPISSKCWEHAYELPLDDIRRYGAWRKVHVYRIPTAVYELYSASMKSWLSFDMIGRGVVLRLMVNDKTAAYRWRVDGGEWIEKNDPLPPGGKNATEWIREDLLTDELSDDKHVVDIRPIFAKDGVGTNFEVFTVGVIR